MVSRKLAHSQQNSPAGDEENTALSPANGKPESHDEAPKRRRSKPYRPEVSERAQKRGLLIAAVLAYEGIINVDLSHKLGLAYLEMVALKIGEVLDAENLEDNHIPLRFDIRSFE